MLETRVTEASLGAARCRLPLCGRSRLLAPSLSGDLVMHSMWCTFLLTVATSNQSYQQPTTVTHPRNPLSSSENRHATLLSLRYLIHDEFRGFFAIWICHSGPQFIKQTPREWQTAIYDSRRGLRSSIRLTSTVADRSRLWLWREHV